MSGLSLGLFALGNLLELYHPALRYLLGIAAIFIYLLLIIGILRNLPQAKEQLQQPLVASVFPTFLCLVCCLQATFKFFRIRSLG